MATIADLRLLPYRRIYYMVKINLKGGGAPTLYVTDRHLAIDWSGDYFEAGYLLEVPEITHECRREDSGGLNGQVMLKLKNDPILTYSSLSSIADSYVYVGAKVNIWEVFYTDQGNVSSDRNLIFTGNVDKIERVDDEEFHLSVESREHYKDSQIKMPIIDEDTYPSAHPDDLGKIEPVIYGDGILVPALKTTWSAESTLPSQINAIATSIEISDADNFPSSGTIRIDTEQITYTGKSTDTLTGCTRGASGTTASKHAEGATVYEVLSEYKALLSRFELNDVTKIYAEVNGELIRVTSGVTDSVSGGKHYLSATSELTYDVTTDDIKASVTTDQPPSTRIVTRYGTPQTVRKWDDGAGDSGSESATITFPSAPAGTMEWVRIHVQWEVVLINAPTGAGFIYAQIGGYNVATIDIGGLTKHFNSNMTIGNGTSWPSSISLGWSTYGSLTGDWDVYLGVGQVWVEAEISGTDQGDPDGGLSSRPTSTTIPLTCTTSSNLAFPSAPSGSLGDGFIEIAWEGNVNATSTNDHFLTIDGERVAMVPAWSTAVKSLSSNPYILRKSSWDTSIPCYHTGTGGTINFKITDGKQSFNNTAETPIVDPSVSNSGSTIGTHKITRLWALVDGTASPSSDYGTLGTTIERPDYAVKHWLVYVLGVSLSNIDATSFNAAGTTYASNNTKIQGRFSQQSSALEEAREMCRSAYSVLQTLGGEWFLSALPTTAPSVSKTLTEDDWAKPQEKLFYTYTDRARVKNDVLSSYQYRWLTSNYIKNYTKTDVATGYDTYEDSIAWPWIKTIQTATSATDQYVRERRKDLIIIEFPINAEHLDIVPGDTIGVIAAVWGGGTKKFWVQRVRRTDRDNGVLTLLEWY